MTARHWHKGEERQRRSSFSVPEESTNDGRVWQRWVLSSESVYFSGHGGKSWLPCCPPRSSPSLCVPRLRKPIHSKPLVHLTQLPALFCNNTGRLCVFMFTPVLFTSPHDAVQVVYLWVWVMKWLNDRKSAAPKPKMQCLQSFSSSVSKCLSILGLSTITSFIGSLWWKLPYFFSAINSYQQPVIKEKSPTHILLLPESVCGTNTFK